VTADVRFGSSAAVQGLRALVRFAPQSGLKRTHRCGPLGAKSGLMQCSNTPLGEIFRWPRRRVAEGTKAGLARDMAAVALSRRRARRKSRLSLLFSQRILGRSSVAAGPQTRSLTACREAALPW